MDELFKRAERISTILAYRFGDADTDMQLRIIMPLILAQLERQAELLQEIRDAIRGRGDDGK